MTESWAQEHFVPTDGNSILVPGKEKSAGVAQKAFEIHKMSLNMGMYEVLDKLNGHVVELVETAMATAREQTIEQLSTDIHAKCDDTFWAFGLVKLATHRCSVLELCPGTSFIPLFYNEDIVGQENTGKAFLVKLNTVYSMVKGGNGNNGTRGFIDCVILESMEVDLLDEDIGEMKMEPPIRRTIFN